MTSRKATSMSQHEDLIRRLRAGDQAAATEFFEEYREDLRRVIQARLRASGVTSRAMGDTSDIFQLVMAGFLVGSAVGRYPLDRPEEVRAVLGQIAQRRVIDLVRRIRARGPTPEGGVGAGGLDPVAPDPGPLSHATIRDLIEAAQEMLTPTEREIAEMRKDGLSWEEIGRRTGRSAEAARKLSERASDRILRTLEQE